MSYYVAFFFLTNNKGVCIRKRSHVLKGVHSPPWQYLSIYYTFVALQSYLDLLSSAGVNTYCPQSHYRLLPELHRNKMELLSQWCRPSCARMIRIILGTSGPFPQYLIYISFLVLYKPNVSKCLAILSFCCLTGGKWTSLLFFK